MTGITAPYVLANGVNIPCLGFGTWQTPDGEVAAESVKTALACGYRHIDTAAVYGNEAGVGEGIRLRGIAREEIFVTSKLWNADRGYDKTLAAFEASLTRLGLEYLDLYLIHWPAAKGAPDEWQRTNAETWRAFEHIYESGRARAIGVSNFLTHHLEPLLAGAKVMPMVDQIEYHPGYRQEETAAYCGEHGILVEAWSPLGTGKMLCNETLMAIAAKYGKSAAQLCIRWCLQNNTLPLVKSVTPSRILENAQVFDFTIDDADMRTINAMPYFAGSGFHPDRVNF